MAWERQNVQPEAPEWLTGKTVAVVGSGPAGLAAAQQLTRAGHTVAVYERDDKAGGLLRYGIPEFKMEKIHVDRRIDQMEREGTVFRSGVAVGEDITGSQLRDRYDAVVLAIGATVRRDLPVPGRELAGIHQAMEFLPQANRVALGEDRRGPDPRDRQGRRHHRWRRHRCRLPRHRHPPGRTSVTSLEIMPRPSDERPEQQPWPTYPMIYRVASAHEEGGERVYSVSTKEFVGRGRQGLRVRLVEVEFKDGPFHEVPGSEREHPGPAGAAGHGLHRPAAGRDRRAARRRARRARQHRAGQELHVQRRRRLRGRRRRARAVADRVGDRRGTGGGGRRRPYLSGTTNLPSPIPPDGSTARRCARPPDGRSRVDGTALIAVRSAKIVCTLGPATDTYEQIRELADAGMNVARINLSHGKHAEHAKVYEHVRRASEETGHGRSPSSPTCRARRSGWARFADGPVDAGRGDAVHDHHRRRRRGRRHVLARRTRGCPATSTPATRSSSTTAGSGSRVTDVDGTDVTHQGRGRRPGQRQQGHQPARRRGQRAGAERQGHRRPALGAAAGRRLRRAVVRAVGRRTSRTCAT